MATKKSTQILTPTTSSPAAATGLAVVPKSTVPKKPVLPKVLPKEKAVTTSPKTPPKRKTMATAKPELVLSREVLHDEIRRESYDYYIQRGYRIGDPKADWLRAEDAVLRRHGLR